LPGGNESLTPLTWQPVPGCTGVQIYPLIRKIDTVSSNSYLIQTPDAIILIDPGGLPGQAGHLMSVVSGIQREVKRPVFVFLTHAHIDHFVGVLDCPAFAYRDIVVFAVQEHGARALETADRKLTQAELLDCAIAPVPVGLRLFPAVDEGPGRIDTVFPNGASIRITRDVISGGPGPAIPHERISFGPGPALDIYHTPGHSPDSICLRIGGLLFIGDLLFAASPGIAGQFGWSQEALITSLEGISGLLPESGISIVCPGHGRVLSMDDSIRMLAGVRNDAAGLADIVELNRERALQTAAYAEDCMDQVNELFTVMAGRLYYISYVMDELGESGMAEEVHDMIGGDAIDDLLEAFRAFAEEHHSGRQGTIPLALKAGQVIAKLQRAFNRDELAHIIDPSLVTRAERLLTDYTTVLRGFNPPRDLSEQEVNGLLDIIVTGLSVPSCPDDVLLSSADDDETFAGMLLARIGMPPLLEDVTFSRESGPEEIVSLVDKAHFSDLVTYIFEDLVGTGADGIILRSCRKGKSVTLSVCGNGCTEASPGTGKSRRFLRHLSVRAGGVLGFEEGNGTRRYDITLDLIR